ncbi:hypothetical protein MKX01_042049 [Papaver californicum]|nr:hypothetical protein MKX01_042049 [Papaver californicum]
METGDPNSGESCTYLVAPNDGSRNEGLIPQLFTSVPALNEAASYLSQTTSYLTRCFTESAQEPMSRENAQELATLSFGTSRSSSTDGESSYGRCSTNSLTTTAAPSVHDVPTRGPPTHTSEEITQNMEPTQTGFNGLSMFQGLIARARKTVRGSADDIGWLQRASGLPPVEDGTRRFDELLGHIRHGVHTLPNSMVYLLVPGLFSNHGPLYFVNTKVFFSKLGLACHIAKIHSEASVEKNAREIKDYIEEIYWGSGKRVMLLGHSKGGVDAAGALSIYWPDLKDKVAGLALAQSPYGGSPIASDILREGQLGDYGDVQALEDLTYEKRKDFLMKNHLPREVPVVSFHTEAGIVPGILAMSHVAHAELPLVPTLSMGGSSSSQSTKLPVVMPLAAAMAACAQVLQVRYGEKSDGLVTCRDAEVPGSVVVRPKRKLDHAWMVYSSMNNDPGEADASQVCEALLTLLVEVGQKKRLVPSLKDE